MIGWFVHEEKVGGFEKHLRQGEAVFLAAGEYFHLFVDIVAGKEKCAKDITKIGDHVIGSIGHEFFVNRPIGIHRFGLVLGKVIENHIVADEPLSTLEFTPCQNSHESRFPRPVVSHQ